MTNFNIALLNKKEVTQEMIDDFYKMGDSAYSKKWDVSRNWIIRKRKEFGIQPFTQQHGTIPHIFEGEVECKWCPQCKKYIPICEFNKCKSRYDGLRGLCRFHEDENARNYSYTENSRNKKDIWLKSESGRKSRRNIWRKTKAKKNNALGIWDVSHELKTYDLFGKRCVYCGIPLEFNELEFDHFIPISKGGMTTIGNMVPSCIPCNRGRGGKFDRDVKEWLFERFGEVRAKETLKLIKRGLKALSNSVPVL